MIQLQPRAPTRIFCRDHFKSTYIMRHQKPYLKPFDLFDTIHPPLPENAQNKQIYSLIAAPIIATHTRPLYFFLPFFDLEAPPELVDATLEALDGAAELALLPFPDFTLSSALFWRTVSFTTLSI